MSDKARMVKVWEIVALRVHYEAVRWPRQEAFLCCIADQLGRDRKISRKERDLVRAQIEKERVRQMRQHPEISSWYVLWPHAADGEKANIARLRFCASEIRRLAR